MLVITDADSVTDATTGIVTTTTTTTDFAAPTSLLQIVGDPEEANTITVDPSLGYAGQLSLQAGGGDTLVNAGAVALTLAQVASLSNTSEDLETTISCRPVTCRSASTQARPTRR